MIPTPCPKRSGQFLFRIIQIDHRNTLEPGHKPVLLDEIIESLNIRADGLYIDGTFGRGGHSRAILARLGRGGRLLAFDKDPAATGALAGTFRDDPRFEIMQGSFTMLTEVLQRRKRAGGVAGLVLDLGVSSPQLNDAARGFSFRLDGPLDMRMDNTRGPTAADWLASAPETEIADVIYHYGEEPAARRIAAAIARQRGAQKMTSTRQLAALVGRIVRAGRKKQHPATRTFQALRIFINRELDDLRQVLPQAVAALQTGGRLAVISFHSLEDRIVKRFIRAEARADHGLPVWAAAPVATPPRLKSVGKKIRAGAREINANPRARSAVLRVAERC